MSEHNQDIDKLFQKHYASSDAGGFTEAGWAAFEQGLPVSQGVGLLGSTTKKVVAVLLFLILSAGSGWHFGRNQSAPNAESIASQENTPNSNVIDETATNGLETTAANLTADSKTTAAQSHSTNSVNQVPSSDNRSPQLPEEALALAAVTTDLSESANNTPVTTSKKLIPTSAAGASSNSLTAENEQSTSDQSSADNVAISPSKNSETSRKKAVYPELPTEKAAQKTGTSRSLRLADKQAYLPLYPAFATRTPTLQTRTIAPLRPIPVFHFKPLFQFHLVAGLSVSNTYSNTREAKDPYSLGPIGGLGLDYHFAPHWSVSAEAVYLRRGGHSLKQSSTETSQYFYTESKTTRVVTRSLDYVHVPLNLNWKLGARHSFTGGLFGAYLVNTSSDISELNVSPATKSKDDLGSSRGYKGAVKHFTYGATMGYEFKIVPALAIGARYNLGLNDVSNDKYVPTSNRDKIRDFQLFTRIEIFSH